ncbi:hypothetical protein LK537_11235 [Lachnoclostridium pacaense]|uniref:hypothetical protein n=1 Tax=Enterocloster hominis (ex Hitch et al. 2024) TaxID=1917870 RepID=UPI001D0FD535|nr:hypothetical protein [Lachnoclostridium pacaense]MCC2817865.1 hypothetical protein [Lachnoclostridium pacaense]
MVLLLQQLIPALAHLPVPEDGDGREVSVAPSAYSPASWSRFSTAVLRRSDLGCGSPVPQSRKYTSSSEICPRSTHRATWTAA